MNQQQLCMRQQERVRQALGLLIEEGYTISAADWRVFADVRAAAWDSDEDEARWVYVVTDGEIGNGLTAREFTHGVSAVEFFLAHWRDNSRVRHPSDVSGNYPEV